ncbi:MAG: cupin domain-containing protein [Dehalococcoidia bacterium]
MSIEQPANGIQILRSILDAPGVETLEGRIGPLIRVARGACHFFDLPPGGFCGEHAHPTESLIYTVRGEWALCSSGVRRHMRAGDLFWFGDDIPTGYEVPFGEAAYILIFKTQARDSDAAFLEYLASMAEGLRRENAEGVPFHFRELPADHPARVFGRTLPGNTADGPWPA